MLSSDRKTQAPWSMMSDYRTIHRKQDLEMKISSLYRQVQLAIGLLDVSGKEDLISSLDWFRENMNFCLHLVTTQERAEEMDLMERYPEVTFILFKNPTTTGEYINAFADECYTTYFLVLRTDTVLIGYQGQELMEVMQGKNHPALITPVMISSGAEVLPTLRAPHLSGRDFDPLSFTPGIDDAGLEENLYPVMGMGLYDRALFQRLRAYDELITGEFYQMADFGLRCYLLGYSIFTTRNLAVQFPQRMTVVEDRSACEGMNRFYTKALSIRRIAGKNVVEKWKPYVDKPLLNDEIKRKQVIIQKTDFFSLMENWKVGKEE